MRRSISRWALLVLLVALAGAYFGRGQLRYWYIELLKSPVPSEQPRPLPGTNTPSPTATPTPITGAVNLAVPFQAQAPRGDWSEPWQNACEEASAILVDAYWKNEQLSVDDMEQRILQLVAWESTHFGYYQETTAEQTATMLRSVYGYRKVVVIHGATLADVVANVRAGRPVIVPLAGRLLDNPYYTAPGPVYHMLVVKGITEDGSIITNDVGTRHGRNYVYSPAVFAAAMHDLPQGGATFPTNVLNPEAWIETGHPAIVVVYPN